MIVRNQLPPSMSQYLSAQTPEQIFDSKLRSLARKFEQHKNMMNLSLWLGFLFLWPLWILTIVESFKMRDVQNQVIDLGVPIKDWKAQYIGQSDSWAKQNPVAYTAVICVLALAIFGVLLYLYKALG